MNTKIENRDVGEVILCMMRGICTELLLKRLITPHEAEELGRRLCNG